MNLFNVNVANMLFKHCLHVIRIDWKIARDVNTMYLMDKNFVY